MNVTLMIAIQTCLRNPGKAEAGVRVASVRQYSQQPARKRTNRTPDRNMAKA
jgi:hypothetical protein